jgi:hypothetical protein
LKFVEFLFLLAFLVDPIQDARHFDDLPIRRAGTARSSRKDPISREGRLLCSDCTLLM